MLLSVPTKRLSWNWSNRSNCVGWYRSPHWHRYEYGVRHHNWPLFCNRRHFVIWCRTTPVEVSLQSWERELSNAVDCMHARCTVAELCMKNADWPTLASGRDYQLISSVCGAMVPMVNPMLLSSAQILRRGMGTQLAVDRDLKTRLRNAISPACCPSVPFKALVVLLNVPKAAVTE